MQSRFLIAAPQSNSGKTTVTLGLIRALRNSGLTVQPFKCGPDYLDPKLHNIASGIASINLDRYMMSDEHLKDLYHNYGSKADVLITEGVMGLFDGAVKAEGSSADIAGMLQMSVILVVNAKAMAYSAAALLSGFKAFEPGVNITGVIFNFVERESHYTILKTAAEDAGIMPLGFLPSNPDVHIPSRHLGLNTGNGIDYETIIEHAAAHVNKYIDLKQLLNITASAAFDTYATATDINTDKPIKIAVANDAAFNFIYPENIKVLASIGHISYFSPLSDHKLPDADLIYLPGGYPELHLPQLAANKVLKNQLYNYYQNGGKILAECGGMMYLGKAITDENGTSYAMAGIVDTITGMQVKKLSIGYKRIDFGAHQLYGHEFHYSQFVDLPVTDNNIKVHNARNELVNSPVFKTKNLLASYMHFYFGDNIAAIKHLLFES